jgi:D-alanyl-D-alanine carboxypeptidase
MLVSLRPSPTAVLIAVALVASACSAGTPGPGTTDAPVLASRSSPTMAQTATPGATRSGTAGSYELGHFPAVPTGSLPDATTAALQAVLDQAVREGLPGITATLLVAGRGAWSGAAGTADGVKPMEVTSQFGIASTTKTVIAAEILWLVEQGELGLDDPVSSHLPARIDFDTNRATIRNLLAMTSGLPDPELIDDPAVAADPLRVWTPKEVLASVPADRGPAGVTFLYSSTNYILLGLVIEQVTGMSVARALRAHVLADPRLSSLVYQPEERPMRPLALPFIGPTVRPNILALGGGYLATKADASALGSAGGMASDAGALARFAYLLWGGQLLSSASLQAMTDFGSGDGYHEYGLGTIDMTTRGKGFPVPAIGHGGQDGAGYASTMITLPSEATVVTVLINQDVDPRLRAIPIAQELLDALSTADAPPSATFSPTPATIPSASVPAASDSTGSTVVGSQPGTLAVTVGTHAAGFAGVICKDLGNDKVSVVGGDPNEGEWIALEFGSDGTASSLSGALRGVDWRVTKDPQGTLDARNSGTFSGKDAASGADVSGTFACK